MKPGPSILAAILLTGLAVTAAQAQPQVVVQDKLPAGAADAPRTTPSPEVLLDGVRTGANDARMSYLESAQLERNLADADVILRIPVRITGFDLSRMPKGPEVDNHARWEVRLECLVKATIVVESTAGTMTSIPSVVLTPRITNGALDMVQEIGLPFRRWRADGTILRDATYKCGLYYDGWLARKQLCLYNTAGAGNNCQFEGQIPGTF